MVKTKKKYKKRKTKTNTTRKNMVEPLVGFLGAPSWKPTKQWNMDYFGYRKVIPINKFKIIQAIDNKNLATDYKKNKRLYNLASDEYRRRLELLLEKNKNSRKLFHKKTKKKYNKNKIKKNLKKMHIKKVQDLYFLLLKNEKPNKSMK